MQSREALYRTAFELVEDCAAENVRHLEVRYSPILHRKKRLPFEDIVDPVIAGLRDAGAKYNISTGVIVCGIRSMAPKVSMELAELAVAYRGRGVLAFDLAGQEKDYPAKEHREAFQLILEHNINCTVHSGEAFDAQSIAQALHYCGAHRIGHGTTLKEDPDLMRYVRDHRIPLEMCLTSNIQTRAVKSITDHPCGDYFRQGLRVTLNTDNRLMSGTTLSDEIALAVRGFKLSPYELKRIIINGFKSGFMPYPQKARMLREVNLEIDRVFMDAFPSEYDLRGSYCAFRCPRRHAVMPRATVGGSGHAAGAAAADEPDSVESSGFTVRLILAPKNVSAHFTRSSSRAPALSAQRFAA